MRTRALRAACAAAATIAAALTLCVTAAPAAADAVGNPGSFSATLDGLLSLGGPALAYFDQGLAPLTVGGTVDKDGTITVSSLNWDPGTTLNPPDQSTGNPAIVSYDLDQQQLTLHPVNITGSLDPGTGAASLTVSLYATYSGHVDYSIGGSGGSATITCTEASLASPVTIPLSSSGSVSPPLGPSPVAGVPYDPATGDVTLVSQAFTSPTPDCQGGSMIAGASNILDRIKQELIGAAGAGNMWLGGAFAPAFTAPVPPPPPPPGGGDPGTGQQQPGGGQQSNTPPAVKCVVPKLGHASLSDARRKLTAAHCKPGKVTKRHSAKVRSGHLISQRSKPGAKLAAGSAVALTVSSGKPKPKHHRHH
jgi:hypothetical protein